jgi:flavin-binding protein dodecin
MASVAKVVTIIGQSPDGFAEAAQAAVSQAAKTIRNIHGADVQSMSTLVKDNRITMFRTTVNIAFEVED